MSEIRAVETQGIASPIPGLTMVAVLCEAADGWRCYAAAHALDIAGDWEAQKAEAVAWTHRHGNKQTRPQARQYFSFPDDMKFAG